MIMFKFTLQVTWWVADADLKNNELRKTNRNLYNKHDATYRCNKIKSLSSKIGGIFGFSVQYTAAFKFSQFVFVIKLYQK